MPYISKEDFTALEVGTMRFRILAIATLITTIGLAASPSLSQIDLNAQLNAQLKQAVCAQQWRQAIQILDRMRARVPQMESELVSYRRQIQALANTRARIQNWPPNYCTAATSAPVQATQPTPTATPATPATPTTSAITGTVAVNQIEAVFRGRRVRGTVANNTNNPVTQIKVTYNIVRTTDADGQTIPEQVLQTGSAAIAGTIQPGRQVPFESLVNLQIRGSAKVVSVAWKNTLDGSDGANPPRRIAQ
ncbi:hypothetical protein [Argonema antarcticum]|uniref:hypothetical protein n=1 Tax=Argonema antarcticum TaxID=2942763 RepID=UPI00201326A6|nr:hypothetical protein [Argonema antarcticum]MCL1472614.1 hypothetical protein [Argonema antarcticum A004/B2]